MRLKTAEEIRDLAKDISWVKLDQTDDQLEKQALQAGIEALVKISRRIDGRYSTEVRN